MINTAGLKPSLPAKTTGMKTNLVILKHHFKECPISYKSMASPFILGLFISFIGVAVILFLPYQEMQHWVHNLILEHKAVKTIHLFTPISGFYLYCQLIRGKFTLKTREDRIFKVFGVFLPNLILGAIGILIGLRVGSVAAIWIFNGIAPDLLQKIIDVCMDNLIAMQPIYWMFTFPFFPIDEIKQLQCKFIQNGLIFLHCFFGVGVFTIPLLISYWG